MSEIITVEVEQNDGDSHIVREFYEGHVELCTNEKVQSRISESMNSDVICQIPQNTKLKFSKICKIKSTGKIRIKVYDSTNDKFMGWISYKKDDGEYLISIHEESSLEIFNFPEGEISLYD